MAPPVTAAGGGGTLACCGRTLGKIRRRNIKITNPSIQRILDLNYFLSLGSKLSGYLKQELLISYCFEAGWIKVKDFLI